MEILLALAGIAGAALLLTPPSPLPSEADYKKSLEKLKTAPEDPDANTIAGKYIAFVLGDYPGAMPFLAKSSDQILRTLAEHERAPLYTDSGPKKVGMGDEWVSAAKKFPALFRVFYDRASYWYAEGWPDLDPLWKMKTREQGLKLAAARPPGTSQKQLPTGWNPGTSPGSRAPILDGTVSHVGSYSIKVLPSDEKIKNATSGFSTDLIPVSGKTIEVSAYVLADGTDSGNDHVYVNLFDQNGVGFSTIGPFIPMDTPFWQRVYTKADIPRNAARFQFGVSMASKKGTLWVDDVSVKLDGREALKGGSFEGK